MYEKTTCQIQIKFITKGYLQMFKNIVTIYKTLQLFT